MFKHQMHVSPQSAPLPYSKPFQSLSSQFFLAHRPHLALHHLCQDYFFVFFRILFSLYLCFIVEYIYYPSLCLAMERLNALVIHCSLSGASPNCGSHLLLLFSPLLLFSGYNFFQFGTSAFVQLRSSKFICLSLMAIKP